jgi:hypothetical protein
LAAGEFTVKALALASREALIIEDDCIMPADNIAIIANIIDNSSKLNAVFFISN